MPKPAFQYRSPVHIPQLLRFLGLHMALGIAIGVAFAAFVVLSNVSGIKDLIASSEQPYLALSLLFSMNALTFAAVQIGIAVMTLPFDECCDMRDPHRRKNDAERGNDGR